MRKRGLERSPHSQKLYDARIQLTGALIDLKKLETKAAIFSTIPKKCPAIVNDGAMDYIGVRTTSNGWRVNCTESHKCGVTECRFHGGKNEKGS